MASALDTDVTDEEHVDHGTVVFLKDGADTESDIWDDTALIKAYDKAIQQAHQSNSGLKPPKSKKKKNKARKSADSSAWKWSVGNWCRAVYSEDGLVYDAVIKQMLPDGKCIVLYTDYGNEEEQPIKNLLRPQRPRQRSESVRSVHSEAACSDCSNKQSTPKLTGPPRSSRNSDFPSFIPPPPPSLPGMPPCDADEAFHSMLISWYMSGFHTGYYQGLRDGKDSV